MVASNLMVKQCGTQMLLSIRLNLDRYLNGCSNIGQVLVHYLKDSVTHSAGHPLKCGGT